MYEHLTDIQRDQRGGHKMNEQPDAYISFPPDPKTVEEILAYVDSVWNLSLWARICYGTKEEAIRQLQELMRQNGDIR